MVVAQFTGFGGETQVRDGGNGDVSFFGVESKALCPAVFGLVLQFEG